MHGQQNINTLKMFIYWAKSQIRENFTEIVSEHTKKVNLKIYKSTLCIYSYLIRNKQHKIVIYIYIAKKPSSKVAKFKLEEKTLPSQTTFT